MGLMFNAVFVPRWMKSAFVIFTLYAGTTTAVSAQTFTTLHSFDGTDGAYPVGALFQATDGNLYGTTIFLGADGDGTVFKIATTGTLTNLQSFDGTNGAEPEAAFQATNGNFYGTTTYGGANNLGTVFKVTPGGVITTVYSFCFQINCKDGEYPSPLAQAANGNFYGTTIFGGAHGRGTVFKITPSGTLTTLYNFCAQSGCPDGSSAVSGVIQGTDGNFYGTTETGGTTNTNCPGGCGTIFKMAPNGTLT
jgi:uncharacterized repeat protein (TIGR03803 family)